MKMIYQPRNKSRNRNSLVVPLIVLAVLSLGGWLFLRFAPNTSHEASVGFAQPIWKARAAVLGQFSYVGTFFQSHRALVEENRRLQNDLIEARAKLSSVDVLVSEHQKLLENYGRGEMYKRTLGVVVAKPPQSPYDTLVIDIGRSTGVVVGNYVYGVGNVVLGVVSALTERTATVTLFSNSDSETGAVVERSNISLAVVGAGGGGFEAKVPQDVDVVVGDKILLPALNVSLMGEVVAVESTAASSFKRVVIQSPVNITSVRWVEVALDIPA